MAQTNPLRSANGSAPAHSENRTRQARIDDILAAREARGELAPPARHGFSRRRKERDDIQRSRLDLRPEFTVLWVVAVIVALVIFLFIALHLFA